MVLVAVNKPRQLLYIAMIGEVTAAELAAEREQMPGHLTELEPGFRVLSDLERLDQMELAGAVEIGRVMELCDAKGVGLVVRVIPDPSKDIGLSILSLFHYVLVPRTATCRTLCEAWESLA